MNFEILSYCLVFVSAIIFSVSNKSPAIVFRASLLIIAILYVVSIRLAEFNGDINNYARAFHFNPVSLYYLKESIYWLGSRLVFLATNNEVITFVIIDLLVVSLLFTALRMFGAPKYAFFLVLIIFPSVFGFQNIYRQLIASSILLLGLGSVYAGKRGWIISATSAAFVHNPAALMIPLSLGFVRRSRWFGALIGLLLGGALSILARFESSSGSGGNFAIILSLVIIIIIIIMTLLIKRSSKHKDFIGFFWGIGVISIFSPILLSPSIAERLSFYMIVLLFPFVVVLAENRVRPIAPIRIFVVLFFTVPTFISSARSFIF